jgi:hypothetical protein
MPLETPMMNLIHAYMETLETGKAHPPNIVDISNSDEVTWAFASRNHPTHGVYQEWDSFGSGLEAYHTVNEHFCKKGGGSVIYSCLPIAERTGLKVPLIMRFEDNYP